MSGLGQQFYHGGGRMKIRMLVGASLLLAVGALGCGGGSSKDDCGDIAKKACEKLYDCGYFYSLNGVTPVTEDVCRNQVEAQLAVNGVSDEQCRDEWEIGGDIGCGAYLGWFNQ